MPISTQSAGLCSSSSCYIVADGLAIVARDLSKLQSLSPEALSLPLLPTETKARAMRRTRAGNESTEIAYERGNLDRKYRSRSLQLYTDLLDSQITDIAAATVSELWSVQELRYRSVASMYIQWGFAVQPTFRDAKTETTRGRTRRQGH